MAIHSTYKVRRPRIIPYLLYIILLMGWQAYFYHKNQLLPDYFIQGWLAVCLVITLILIHRAFTLKKYFEIQIKQDSIMIAGEMVNAKDIKTIFIKGYFKPLVGIKPINKTLVPFRLCFRFQELEDQGMKDLTAWAEHNQIEVLYKGFTRLI